MLAYIKLGIIAKCEYRFNSLIGIVVLPLVSFGVELAFWLGVFATSGQATIGGYSLPQYVTYLLWIMLQVGSANFRFERVMIQEINTGAVNAFLLRPTSFYEYHLGEFLGNKLMTMIVMLPLMLGISWWWQLPLHYERLLPCLVLGFWYLIMLHTLNFALCSMAFFFDHIYSINTTKNMIIWFLVGELFPLDLLPSPLREWVIALPFSSGIYLPAAYLSGRVSGDALLQGFFSVFVGIMVFGLLGRSIWKQGLKSYSGTGA